jgi:hypothetical protein
MDSGHPISLVLDNARYQKCQCVADKAKELGIELLYLPPYSPNLNLIERLWRFVKKEVLYRTYYDNFKKFKANINTCLAEISTRFRTNMESLMTMNFHLFGSNSHYDDKSPKMADRFPMRPVYERPLWKNALTFSDVVKQIRTTFETFTDRRTGKNTTYSFN